MLESWAWSCPALFVDLDAVVIGSLDPALEALFVDRVRRPADGAPSRCTERPAETVVELQTSPRGIHTGQIIVLGSA